MSDGLITLWTTNDPDLPPQHRFQYYLQYSGAQLLDVAANNLGIGDARTGCGVLLVSASRGGTRQWVHANRTFSEFGPVEGDIIAVVPPPPGFDLAPPVVAPSPTATPVLPPLIQTGFSDILPVSAQKPRTKLAATIAYTARDYRLFQLPVDPLTVIRCSGTSPDRLIVNLNEFQYSSADKIGSGAFGVVYQSRDPRSGRSVAIKVVNVDAMSPEHRSTFDREVQILASVDHAALLGFRGYAPLTSEKPAIVTDYLPGGSYQRLLAKDLVGEDDDMYDETARLIILYGIAVGMMVLHMKRILHRDLKPDNVLLDERLEPRVADFGLSKKVAHNESHRQTITAGTPIFMAPELVESMTYGFEVDVYAYGILLFLAITRHEIDPEASQFLFWKRIAKGCRPGFPPGTDPEWVDLIQACWHQSPTARPTFYEIVGALGSPLFVRGSINADRFYAYQERILPAELWTRGKPLPAGVAPLPTPPPYEGTSLYAPATPLLFDFTKVQPAVAVDNVIQPSRRNLSQLVVRLKDFPNQGQIGRGAFGECYMSRHPGTGNVVAVKIMRNVGDEWRQQSYLREVEILASADHPTLLALRGYVPLGNAAGDPPAIITDFMQNGSQHQVIAQMRRGTAPPRWDSTSLFIVIYGVAIGMMVLHIHGIIHRDLKPENVFLDASFEPRVADFGLSKFIERGKSVLMSVTGGTGPFMAPEIFEGLGKYDMPVDVYAFGMFVYMATTGRDIFPNARSQQAIGDMVTRGLRPPFPPQFDERWKILIEQCWTQSPSDRPTFAQIVTGLGTEFYLEMVDDIDRFLAYQARVLPPELRSPVTAVRGANRALHPSKTPVQIIRECAEAGDPYSANLYGCLLRDGRDGVGRDHPRAAQFFEQAARGGNVDGMLNYGLCLEKGRGVPVDLVQSADWYRRAMMAGDLHAVFCYADMLEFGKGVPKDMAEAVRLYKQAAEQGHDRAQSRYGVICEYGLYGVTKDVSQAIRYYQMAAEQGSPQGMFCYADMLEGGKGVQQNMGEAIQLYRLAANKRHPKAMGYYGFLQVTGNGVPLDVESSLSLIHMQIQCSDPTGYLYMGRIADEGITGPANPQEAFAQYKKAADSGVPQGRLKIAGMMVAGRGTEKNVKLGVQMYRDLIDKDKDANAMIALAMLYYYGDGVSKDRNEAKRLLTRARDQGSAKAADILDRITRGATAKAKRGKRRK
jgi:serine/threonine protein kinase/TPR repeat protein